MKLTFTRQLTTIDILLDIYFFLIIFCSCCFCFKFYCSFWQNELRNLPQFEQGAVACPAFYRICLAENIATSYRVVQTNRLLGGDYEQTRRKLVHCSAGNENSEKI